MKTFVKNFLLSLVGIGLLLGLWTFLSGNIAKDLPSPVKTWQESKLYVTQPWD